MKSSIKTALILFSLMSLVLGVLYPLAVTGIAQLFFPFRANGSLIYKNGKIIGSELIGQAFASPRYFHGRPSAVNHDGGASGASNYGPTEARSTALFRARITDIRNTEMLDSTRSLPADLITASASGLDPHISPEAAIIQVPRIAQNRGLDETWIRSLAIAAVERPAFSPPRVNVLKLNRTLDRLTGMDVQNRKEKP